MSIWRLGEIVKNVSILEMHLREKGAEADTSPWINEIKAIVQRAKADRDDLRATIDGLRAEVVQGYAQERDEALARLHASMSVTLQDAVESPYGFFVYVLWDENGIAVDRPLYIGQTNNIIERLAKHMRAREIGKTTIARINIRRCDSRNEALQLERDLIEAMGPLLNVTGNTAYVARGTAHGEKTRKRAPRRTPTPPARPR